MREGDKPEYTDYPFYPWQLVYILDELVKACERLPEIQDDPALVDAQNALARCKWKPTFGGKKI